MSPENTAPENTAPENTAPGNTAPGNTAPGNTAPGNTGQHTLPEHAGPQNAAASSPADSPTASTETSSAASSDPQVLNAASQEATASDPAATADESAERILLLAPAGPLLIDVRLTIDGRPHKESMAALIGQVMQEADTNADQQVTWDEITLESSLRYGDRGNLVAANEAERLRLIQLYDFNGNLLAESDELRRFITRNAGASKSFNLRSSNYYRDVNRWESALRMLLDENGDRVISADEMAQSGLRMRSRDADADDLLLAGDFREDGGEDVGALEMQRANIAETAFHLNDVRDWSHVLYALEETYALGRLLQPGNLRRDPELFAALDANADGQIDTREVTRLLAVPPQLVVSAGFGVSGDEGRARAKLDIVGEPQAADMLVSQPSANGDRLSVTLPDVNLVIFVRDEVVSDYLAQANRLLPMYDQNNDGYLEASEYAEQLTAAAGSFESLDENQDGKVYAEEIAGKLALRGAAERSQLRSRAGEDRDALFACLDVDHDGRLVAREILGAPQRLEALDRNGDQELSIDEIPTAMLLGIVRGDPQSDAQLFQLRPAAPRLSDVPAWFAAMDTNRDGEIGRTEFLGSLADFERLDANGDGFLNSAESGQTDL
jgi:Ca2+-binding EF-hand superfamily protein